VSTLTLVLTAVGSVLLLLFLVMKARMHAFVALMVVSIGAGLFSGMPLDKIAATMEKGMGGTLGFLAIVVALGRCSARSCMKPARSIRLPSRC
jgi:Gnt-I system low-affinity gluconate transporter